MRASGNGELAVDRRLQTDLVNNHNSARRQLLPPFNCAFAGRYSQVCRPGGGPLARAVHCRSRDIPRWDNDPSAPDGMPLLHDNYDRFVAIYDTVLLLSRLVRPFARPALNCNGKQSRTRGL